MSAKTSIEWTDATWNPVRGCELVSPGCLNCYAMKFAHRFSGKGKAYAGLTRIGKTGPVWTGEVRTVPTMLDYPLRLRRPHRIFVNSTSDLFHKDVPEDFIWQVFAVMANAPQHTFQILTKRAERMCRLLATGTGAGFFYGNVRGTAFRMKLSDCFTWPLPNVWLGVSAEDQKRWDERVQYLGQTPAVVRFVSAEPLLGPIDCGNAFDAPPEGSPYAPVDWVIVGGESGPAARPFDIAWARSIVEDCRLAGVPVFVKQLGANPRTEGIPGYGDAMEKIELRDRKGGDPVEWPSDLRVRQFPEVR